MRRKIKVLFVFEGLYGRGAERVALRMASLLDRQQFEPALWVLRSEDDLRDEVPRDARVSVVLHKDERIRNKLLAVPASLLRQAREADVIIGGVELMPTYFAYLAGVLSGKPVVGWVHNSMDRTYAEQPQWNRRLSSWIYPRLARIVSVSRGTQTTLAHLHPLRQDRAEVIYNPHDLAGIQSKQREALPAWAAFMLRRPSVLGMGRLTRQKGFDLLIEAHARLLEQGFEHDLVILGEGELRADLERLAQALGVQGSVHLPGGVTNPYPILQQATAFALSSRWEGLPGVLIEALACGTPVVAFDCPSGPAEILEHGRDGLLVPPEDVEALTAALAQLLSDEAARQKFRENGPRRAQDFAGTNIMAHWTELLSSISRAR